MFSRGTGHLFLVSLAALMSSPAFGEIGRIKSSSGVATVQRERRRFPRQRVRSFAWRLAGDGKGRTHQPYLCRQHRFAVGPDSRIALKKFEYDPTTQKGSFVAKVERGSIAVVTGRITKTRCDFAHRIALRRNADRDPGIRHRRSRHALHRHGEKMKCRSIAICAMLVAAGCAHSVVLLPDEDGGHGEIGIQQAEGKR